MSSFEDWSPLYTLLLGVGIGLLIGTAAVGAGAGDNVEQFDDEPATVRCTTFLANESPSALCFASGDVRVEFVESFDAVDGNSSNETVSFYGLPANNTTEGGR